MYQNITRSFCTNIQPKIQKYFPQLTKIELQSDYFRLNPAYRHESFKDSIPIQCQLAMTDHTFYASNIKPFSPVSVLRLMKLFEENGINYEDFLLENEIANNSDITTILEALKYNQTNPNYTNILNRISEMILSHPNYHIGQLKNEMHNYNPYFEHEYGDIFNIYLDNLHEIYSQLNKNYKNNKAHIQYFNNQQTLFHQIYERYNQLNNTSKYMHSLNVVYNDNKKFNKNHVRVSQLHKIFLKTALTCKQSPLGKEYLLKLFNPGYNLLGRSELLVDFEYIKNNLVFNGIVSDVLETAGFQNLHYSAILMTLVDTLHTFMPSEINNKWNYKPQTYVEICKKYELEYDTRYDANSSEKFSESEDVRDKMFYKDLEQAFYNRYWE